MRTEDSLLTPEQVSEILQINVLTVYNYIKRGKLAAIRLGRSYRIPPEDLKHLIESNKVKNIPGESAKYKVKTAQVKGY